jgi:hypothetical protein
LKSRIDYEPVVWKSCKRKFCDRAPYNVELGEFCCRKCKDTHTFLDDDPGNGKEKHAKDCNREHWTNGGWKQAKEAHYIVSGHDILPRG